MGFSPTSLIRPLPLFPKPKDKANFQYLYTILGPERNDVTLRYFMIIYIYIIIIFMRLNWFIIEALVMVSSL